MAVYKLFPEKDATIYSGYPYLNTGLDEILEISTYSDPIYGSNYPATSRILIQFKTSEIQDVINNIISGSNYDVNLKLNLANASNIPLTYQVECYPLSQSWDMGTGKYSNIPITTDGVNWIYTGASYSSSIWQTSSFNSNATASFLSTNKGGGVWISSSYQSTQSFDYIANKDLKLNVKDSVVAFYSGTLNNYGFIIKQQDNLEFNSSRYWNLKYFSSDTHTIYPPNLEFRWDDYSYSTGSSISPISTDNIVITLANNKEIYNQDEIYKFRINTRHKYPTRTFITGSAGSIYTINRYLPTSSYYALKDLDTEEIIHDFHDTYTKLSADSEGNYFKLYMAGLEPKRYYKILIKVVYNGETMIYDDNYYFKID